MWFENFELDFLQQNVDQHQRSRNKNGYTALMLAAQQNNVAAVHYLRTFEAGQRSQDGQTAFEISLRSQSFRAAELLADLEFDEAARLTLHQFFPPMDGFPALLSYCQKSDLTGEQKLQLQLRQYQKMICQLQMRLETQNTSSDYEAMLRRADCRVNEMQLQVRRAEAQSAQDQTKILTLQANVAQVQKQMQAEVDKLTAKCAALEAQNQNLEQQKSALQVELVQAKQKDDEIFVKSHSRQVSQHERQPSTRERQQSMKSEQKETKMADFPILPTASSQLKVEKKDTKKEKETPKEIQKEAQFKEASKPTWKETTKNEKSPFNKVNSANKSKVRLSKAQAYTEKQLTPQEKEESNNKILGTGLILVVIVVFGVLMGVQKKDPAE